MQSLARAVSTASVAGEPMPIAYAKLAAMGWTPRRGQVLMIAGAPNAGKSAAALALAKRMNVPSLIFSADTDQFTTALRAGALVTGHSMQYLESQGAQRLAEPLEELDNLRFCFDPSPTLEDIDLEVRAFEEVWGEPPALIVIDNLMNVLCDDGDEFRALRIVMQALHHLARSTRACVIVLHHVTGEFDGTNVPPPRRALHGKVSQLPEMIWTVAQNQGHLGIACVKNRSGMADASANSVVWLKFAPECMSLTE